MSLAFEDLLVKVAQLQLDCHEVLTKEIVEPHTILFHDTFGSQTQHEVHAHDFVAPFLAGLIPSYLRGVKLAYLAPDEQWIELEIPKSPETDDFTMDTFAEHPLWSRKQLKTLMTPIIWFGDMAVRLKLSPMTTLAQTQAYIRTTLKRSDVEIQCQPEQMAQSLLAYEAHVRPILLTSQAADIGLVQLQQQPSPLITLHVDAKSINVQDSMLWS